MSGHTPGPWKAIHNDHYWEVKVAREDDHEETINKYSPATAYAWDVGDETAEANARLIAAAPDFYAMAEMVLAWWDKHQYDTISGADGDEWNVYDDEPDFVTAARAAKAKADGETT